MDIAFHARTGEPVGWTAEAYVLHCRVLRSPADGLCTWFLILEECTRHAESGCEPCVAPIAIPVGAVGSALAAPVLCVSGTRDRPHTLHALLGCVRADGTARACETATLTLAPLRGVLPEPLLVSTGARLELEVLRIEPLEPPCMAHTLAIAARAGWTAEVVESPGPSTLGVRPTDGHCTCAWYHLDDLPAVPPLDLVPSGATRTRVDEARRLLEARAVARPALPLGDLAQRLGHVAVQAAGLLGTPDVRVHLHTDQVTCPPRRLCVPLGGKRRATPVVSLATARASVAKRLAELTEHNVVLERAAPDAPQCLVFRYAHAAQQDSLTGLPVACVVMHVSPDEDIDHGVQEPRTDVLAPTGLSEHLDALLRQQSQRADVHTVLVVNE